MAFYRLIMMSRSMPVSKRYAAQRVPGRGLWFLAVLLVAGVVVGAAARARAADIPYSPNAVAKLQAFLQCPSMVEGKNNAELLGADLDDPTTWSGVSWIDHDPDGPAWDKLSAKHVLHIHMVGSLAGALEVRDLPYLQTLSMDHLEGTVVGERSLYTSIVVKNNARLFAVYIRYANVASVEIEGNPHLETVVAKASDFGTFTLSQPDLTTLITDRITNSSVNISLLPRLRALHLGAMPFRNSGIDFAHGVLDRPVAIGILAQARPTADWLA